MHATTGTRKQDLWCCPQEEKGGLMSTKNDKNSSVVDLKGRTYRISKLGSQVDIFAATTRAIGEYVGLKFGHKMRMLVLYGKAPCFVVPTLDANTENRMS
jgi:hypothetical protein